MIKDARSDAELKQEAEYVKAKSYLAVSRRDEAYVILNELAKDMSSEFGAEAAYMLILDSYDKGNFEDVETKVYAFSDSGSTQTYWPLSYSTRPQVPSVSRMVISSPFSYVYSLLEL